MQRPPQQHTRSKGEQLLLACLLASLLPCFLASLLPCFLASLLASFLPSVRPSFLPSFLVWFLLCKAKKWKSKNKKRKENSSQSRKATQTEKQQKQNPKKITKTKKQSEKTLQNYLIEGLDTLLAPTYGRRMAHTSSRKLPRPPPAGGASLKKRSHFTVIWFLDF